MDDFKLIAELIYFCTGLGKCQNGQDATFYPKELIKIIEDPFEVADQINIQDIKCHCIMVEAADVTNTDY